MRWRSRKGEFPKVALHFSHDACSPGQQCRIARELGSCLSSRRSTPFPLPDLRHVFAIFGDVVPMFDALVAEGLPGIVGLRAAQADAIDHISDQMKPVEIVHHHHIKRGRCSPFFFVPAHVQILVIRPSVGESVDQPRIAVEREDDRLVRP